MYFFVWISGDVVWTYSFHNKAHASAWGTHRPVEVINSLSNNFFLIFLDLFDLNSAIIWPEVIMPMLQSSIALITLITHVKIFTFKTMMFNILDRIATTNVTIMINEIKIFRLVVLKNASLWVYLLQCHVLEQDWFCCGFIYFRGLSLWVT